MGVLSEYYDALGRIITRHAATLISFSGDGLMVLVSAPYPVEDAALRAVDLAVEMQQSVQDLIAGWRVWATGSDSGWDLLWGRRRSG